MPPLLTADQFVMMAAVVFGILLAMWLLDRRKP
jgi:hypothetical protein